MLSRFANALATTGAVSVALVTSMRNARTRRSLPSSSAIVCGGVYCTRTVAPSATAEFNASVNLDSVVVAASTTIC